MGRSKSHRFHGKRDFKPEKVLRGGDVNVFNKGGIVASAKGWRHVYRELQSTYSEYGQKQRKVLLPTRDGFEAEETFTTPYPLLNELYECLTIDTRVVRNNLVSALTPDISIGKLDPLATTFKIGGIRRDRLESFNDLFFYLDISKIDAESTRTLERYFATVTHKVVVKVPKILIYSSLQLAEEQYYAVFSVHNIDSDHNEVDLNLLGFNRGERKLGGLNKPLIPQQLAKLYGTKYVAPAERTSKFIETYSEVCCASCGNNLQPTDSICDYCASPRTLSIISSNLKALEIKGYDSEELKNLARRLMLYFRRAGLDRGYAQVASVELNDLENPSESEGMYKEFTFPDGWSLLSADYEGDES